MYYLEPLDCEGQKINIGDDVSLVKITDKLLDDLPIYDQEAIKSQIGNIFKVSEFDDYGFVEIEFEYKGIDSEVTFHTIWLEPRCLKIV